MDKVIVNPSEVRGLGDIVSPKSLSDYIGGEVSSVGDGVFELEYLDGSFLTLTVPATISGDDTSFSVSATLKDSSDTAISSATVYCDVNGTVLTGTTNSNGVVSFTVNTDGSSRYDVKVYYTGTSTVAGTVRQCIVRVSDAELTEIGLVTDKSVIQSGDTVHFISQVTGTGDLSGVTVEFYKGED